MAQFTVTFEHKKGHTIVREIPGKDQADATSYAKSVAKRGYTVVAVKPAQNHPSCHYCGMPATSFGFFDEPVCPECGG